MALVSLREASTKYGLSAAYLRRLCIRGIVSATKFGNSWAIDTASLERYLASERKRGPKPKRS
jgi:hypothetical protein